MSQFLASVRMKIVVIVKQVKERQMGMIRLRSLQHCEEFVFAYYSYAELLCFLKL